MNDVFSYIKMPKSPFELLLVIFLVACSEFEFDQDEPCKDVGYSISARVFACVNDHQTANETYRLFDQTYQCNTQALKEIQQTEGIKALFHCSRLVNEMTCEQIDISNQVETDDLHQWLSIHDPCQSILIETMSQ